MRSIAPSGKVCIGDVRSLPLLEPYHAAVQLARAESDRRINQWQYMIRQAFVFLDPMPLTPNGKVDRRAANSRASYQKSGHWLCFSADYEEGEL